jgi:hypothetical protein
MVTIRVAAEVPDSKQGPCIQKGGSREPNNAVRDIHKGTAAPPRG